MKRKIIRIILISLLSAVFVVSAGMVISYQTEHQKTIDDAEEAARLAGLNPGTRPRPQETAGVTREPPEVTEPSAEEPPEEPLPEEVLDLTGIELEALREVNGDVVGWISIPGTIVSYPLIQGEDNQYYLRRNWKKESRNAGCIFLEAKVSPDLTDFHTIIYGHLMRDETMFGVLKYYRGMDYWREHPSIYIVLNDGIYRYDIFAAHETPLISIVFRLDIEENHLEEEFIQFCKDSSVLDTELTPEAGDRILTLSTCTGNGYSSRWVVHGVLARVYGRTNI